MEGFVLLGFAIGKRSRSALFTCSTTGGFTFIFSATFFSASAMRLNWKLISESGLDCGGGV
jgi:hypothetical protein